MTILRRFVSGIQTVGEREFRGIACTNEYQEQDGFALDIMGGDFSRFANGAGRVFSAHNAAEAFAVVDSLHPSTSKLEFRATAFTDDVMSPGAKAAFRQIKAGVLQSFSIGFIIDEFKPLPRGEPGARLATKWTLLEISATHIPVDTGAVVTARSNRGAHMHPPDSLHHHLAEADRHLEAATEHWADGKHDAAKRRVDLARGHLARAVDAANLAITNPTAAEGAQTSNGEHPRSFADKKAEARRLGQWDRLQRLEQAEVIEQRRLEIERLAGPIT